MLLNILVSVLLGLLGLTIAYVCYMLRRNGELERLGFVAVKPQLFKIPFDVMGSIRKSYTHFKNEKVYGVYAMGRPVLYVRDLDMIKEVLVKNFHCFINRNPTPSVGGPLDYLIIRLNDDQWKHVRSTISPTFSTGKIKLMSKHVESSAKILVENLKEKQERNEVMELREVISCFTMDVTASAGFGMKIDSVKDPDNFFRTAAKNMMTQYFSRFIFFIFVPIAGRMAKFFGISMENNKWVKTLTAFVDEAMTSRREDSGQGKHSDFVQLLVNAENEEIDDHDGSTKEEKEALKTTSHRKGMTKMEIQGQALAFILAGYDTMSTAMSFTLFLMALNPETVRKAQKEVDDKLGGKFPNYDSVQSLSYLEMCLNEAMRMFPPAFMLDRLCAQDVEIQGYVFPKGYQIMVPIQAIHYDPDLWPEPEKFDPERFTPENKADRHPYAHLPFGGGPRNCMGMRLAFVEMKITLAAILQCLTPVPCEKTVYPVKLKNFQMIAKDGLWVRLEARK